MSELYEKSLKDLEERLRVIEERVSNLERPTIAYRRPGASEYESLSNTLDYLHISIEELRGYLIKEV